nr:hypothetical protein [uncultured Porphyromonas sp.]
MVILISDLSGGYNYCNISLLWPIRDEEFKPPLELPNGYSEDTFELVM